MYANQLAQRGFVALTFDPCYMGESAGEPRRVSSPDMFSENFSAGVDFLGLLPYADRNKIGALGICGSGGFALSAAAVDTRIKAVVTASMYDMSYAARAGQTPEQLAATKERLSLQRWKDAENGYPEYIPSFSRRTDAKHSRRNAGHMARILRILRHKARSPSKRARRIHNHQRFVFYQLSAAALYRRNLAPAPSSLL